MAETQLVPQIPQEGIQKATQELADLKLALQEYESEAKRLKVDNPVTYEVAGALLTRVRDNQKQGIWIMRPLKTIAATITTTFRQMEQAHINKCGVIEALIEPKMIEFKRREKEAAAIEERRKNEELRQEAARQAEAARKAIEEQAAADRKAREKEIAAAQKAGEMGKREAEKQRKQAEEEQRKQKAEAEMVEASIRKSAQTVEVAPNVPTVAGLRQRQNWTFKVVDIDQIPRPFLYPNVGPDGKYKKEDFPQIGKYVRGCKDKAAAEKMIPGIVVEAIDAI